MQKIQITNFGPIEYAEVEIKDMVIFIGEQASGKSTISKLIYFFRSLKDVLFKAVVNLNINSDISDFFVDEIEEKFHSFFGSSLNIQPFHVKYFYQEERFIQLELTPNYQLSITFSDFFFVPVAKIFLAYMNSEKKTTPLQNNLAAAFAEINKKSKFFTEISNEIANAFNDKKFGLFVPAGRNITTTYSEQFKLDFFGNLSIENNKSNSRKKHSGDVYLMIEFLRKIEGVKESFKNTDFDALIKNELLAKNITKDYAQILHKAKNLIFEILKGKYQHDSNGEKIVFNGKNNRSVSLNNASSGQQESIRILQDLFLILLNKEAAFRVIEEPEAHLYPLAQKKLIELIGMVLHHTDSQFLITTHSPYILSVVNNLIFAKSVHNLAEAQGNGVEKAMDLNADALIEPTDFQAYSIKNNDEWEFKSIFDEETKLISENYLDEISQIVGSEFDAMFEVYKQLKPRTRRRKTK